MAEARTAQRSWAQTTYAQRCEWLRLMNDYIVANQELLCRVACRDTGKTMVDGAFGEVLTTCEKIMWTINYGEAALRPEYRSVGMLTMHKVKKEQ